MEDALVKALAEQNNDLVAALRVVAKNKARVVIDKQNRVIGLNLVACGIGDAGVTHLSTLKNLRWIGLAKNSITPAALSQLKLELPACTVLE